MEALKQIANVTGQPGLYRILKPSRAGVIVETLDAKKEKTMMGPTARVSVLSDISIYVDTEEQSKSLGDVLLAVADKFGDEMPVTAKSHENDLADFMAEVVPDYDRERVRMTDIKKLVSWYGILRQYAPEIFEKPAATEAETLANEEPAEPTAEAPAENEPA